MHMMALYSNVLLLGVNNDNGRESKGENVQGNTEEDGVLLVMVNDALEEREEKEQVVYSSGLQE